MDSSRDKTPLEALPEYVDVAEGRNEAVRTWASERVEAAHTELITSDSPDIEQAKRELRVALQILETEIE